MNMERRLARLEGQRSPRRAPGPIQLLDLTGVPAEERERRVAAARERRGDWRPGDPPWVIEILGDVVGEGAP